MSTFVWPSHTFRCLFFWCETYGAQDFVFYVLRGQSVCENGDHFHFAGAFLDTIAATKLKTHVHDRLAKPHVSISIIFLCDPQCPSYSDFFYVFCYTSWEIFQFSTEGLQISHARPTHRDAHFDMCRI